MAQIYEIWHEVNQEIGAAVGADNAAQLTRITYELRQAFGGLTPGKTAPVPIT